MKVVRWVNPFKADVKIQNFMTPHKNQHNNKVMMVRNGLECKRKCVIKKYVPRELFCFYCHEGYYHEGPKCPYIQ